MTIDLTKEALMKLKSGFLTLMTSDGEMEVYFSHADEISHPPVLIVFQEAFGVNEHIKDVCHRFAEEGYFVFAPELYHRHGKYIQFPYSGRSDSSRYLGELTEDDITEDIVTLMEMIREFPQINAHKVATVGFCVGGYVSMLAAARFDLQAAVSFYGAGTVKPRQGFKLGPIKDEFKNITCPLLLFFGHEDVSIPQTEVHEIQNELEDLGKTFKSVVFEKSGHGFFCDQRSSYNKESAHEAWEITLEFLKDNLVHSPDVGSRDSKPGSLGAST